MLFCSLNFLFSDVLVAVVAVVFLNSLAISLFHVLSILEYIKKLFVWDVVTAPLTIHEVKITGLKGEFEWA